MTFFQLPFGRRGQDGSAAAASPWKAAAVRHDARPRRSRWTSGFPPATSRSRPTTPARPPSSSGARARWGRARARCRDLDAAPRRRLRGSDRGRPWPRGIFGLRGGVAGARCGASRCDRPGQYASADISGRGRYADVDVKVASGDVEFEDVSGEAGVNSASGDVTRTASAPPRSTRPQATSRSTSRPRVPT